MIYHIITKVCEKADELDVKVASDLTRNMITGRRTLFFKFTKNGKVIDEVIDEYSIDLAKDLDILINSVIEKMEEVLWVIYQK